MRVTIYRKQHSGVYLPRNGRSDKDLIKAIMDIDEGEYIDSFTDPNRGKPEMNTMQFQAGTTISVLEWTCDSNDVDAVIHECAFFIELDQPTQVIVLWAGGKGLTGENVLFIDSDGICEVGGEPSEAEDNGVPGELTGFYGAEIEYSWPKATKYIVVA